MSLFTMINVGVENLKKLSDLNKIISILNSIASIEIYKKKFQLSEKMNIDIFHQFTFISNII